MSPWRSVTHQRTWRTYFETSLLLETHLDEDLRSATGLSLIDYHFLLLLSESPSHRLRMSDLATRMVFSPSRVTYQVRSMERRDWVVRQASASDKRVTYAVLTATGLEALREASPHHVDTIQTLFTNDLDDDELRVLSGVFTRLQRNLVAARTSQDSEDAPTVAD